MPSRFGDAAPTEASYILNISDLKSQKTAPALHSAGAVWLSLIHI